jgi:hypothetical protein
MKLVAQPQPARLEDYRRAAEELEERLRGLPGLVAVYRIGGVSAPGISDLDRVAVVDTAGPVPDIWPDLSAATRALSMHPPFLVEPAVFASHRLISHLDPLELATGVEIELEERPDPDYVKRLLGAESLLLNVVRLLKYRATGRIKVRAVLCQLHTVRHGLGLAALDRTEAPAAWQVSNDVAALRGAWFALPAEQREERLRGLVVEAVPALIGALDSLAAHVPSAHPSSNGRVALGDAWAGITLRGVEEDGPTPPPRPGGRLTAAVAGLSPKTAEAAWRLVLRRREVVLPARLVALLAGCAPDHAEVCARRARVLARHREFLSGRGRGYTSIAIAPSMRRA